MQINGPLPALLGLPGHGRPEALGGVEGGFVINLYNMDCMEAMAGMGDGEYDLAIVDPPYFLPARHYATRKNFKRNFSDMGLVEFFFRDYFIQLSRILKSTGSFYIFCDGQSYPIFYYHSYFFL